MTAKADDIALRIDAALEREHKNARAFAIGLVLMTPGLVMVGLALVGAVAIRMLARSGGGPNIPYFAFDIVFALVVFVAVSRRPKGVRLLELVIGLSTYVFMVYLSFQTGTSALVYGVLAFVLLGVLGRSYKPRDDYDFSYRPFTFSDDADRAHAAMGFLVAIPSFLLSAYGELFSGSLFRARPMLPLDCAANLLLAASRSRIPLPVPSDSDGQRSLAVLVRVDLVRLNGGRYEATLAGKDLLS